MMQIIHDVAPGASQAFHTAFTGVAGFAQGIRDLANAGAKVIVDDVIYFAEPMFQDGPIAQAANDVARNQDAAYFTSAGNNGRNSYESAFQPSGESGVLNTEAELHDFGGGDTGQRITIPDGDSVRIALQWTDPYASLGGPGADSDLDIFLTDQAGNVVARSDFDNIEGDPFEFLEFTNDGSIDADNDGTPDSQFEIGIELFEGPAPELFKYVYFPSGDVAIAEYEMQSQTPTLYGHANAEDAMAVGAVFWFATPEFDDRFTNPFEINGYSSRGGVPIHFTPEGTPLGTPVTRNKPDMVGPDGTNTTFFGQELNDGPDGDSGDGFPNFFGTSAAAPHVAAVAALMLEFDPGRAPAQVYADLKSTAIDMDNPATPGFDEGFDFATGFGLVQADEAVPLAAEVVRFSATPSGGGNTISISWEETGTAEIEEYVLERKYFDGSFEEIATLPSDGTSPQTFTFETETLGLGQYTFRLSWRRPDGTTETSPQQPTVTVGLQTFSASITGEDEDDVQLEWSVPESTSGYNYTVQYRAQDAFQDAGTTTDRSFTVTGLQPGQYDFRLRMEDASGNVLFSEVLTEQVPLEGAVAITNTYPNPTAGPVNFTITTERQQVVEIRVYNTAGRLVQLEFRQLDELVPTPVTLDLSNQVSGKYFIQVFSDDFSESRSVVRIQ
jgi:subtilisin family serine protease